MNDSLDLSYIINNKIVKHTVNGISRFLILWIIMDKGPIHGYRIMGELDAFFKNLIDVGSLNKYSASKLYPILKDMEKNGLIEGEIKIKDNKKVIYYKITDAGEYLVYYICDNYKVIKNTSKGSSFIQFLNE